MPRLEPCPINQILQEDARRICTPQRAKSIWNGIEPELQNQHDAEQISDQVRGRQEFTERLRKGMAAFFCATSLLCYATAGALFSLPVVSLPQAAPGHVIIEEEAVPQAPDPNAPGLAVPRWSRASGVSLAVALGTIAGATGVAFILAPRVAGRAD